MSFNSSSQASTHQPSLVLDTRQKEKTLEVKKNFEKIKNEIGRKLLNLHCKPTFVNLVILDYFDYKEAIEKEIKSLKEHFPKPSIDIVSIDDLGKLAVSQEALRIKIKKGYIITCSIKNNQILNAETLLAIFPSIAYSKKKSA